MQKTDKTSSDDTGEPSEESAMNPAEVAAIVHDQHAPYGRTRSGKIRTAPRMQTARSVVQYSATENQKRVDEVCEVLKALQFRKRTTVKMFAKRWGVTHQYADHICSKAVRLMREELTDSDAVGVTAGEALNRIIVEGMASKKFSDRKIVIEAVKQLTMLAPGLRAPTEHTLRVDTLPDDPAELIRMAKELAKAEEIELDMVTLTEREDGTYE